MLKEDFLELLVCPIGRARLRQEDDVLICTRCGTRFAVEDDIPNMLVDDAEHPRRLRLAGRPRLREKR